MIIIPVVLLAAGVGVVLAALESPYAYNKVRIERFSILIVAIGAATLAAGGVLYLRNWLPG